jgi:hypothetical protein
VEPQRTLNATNASAASVYCTASTPSRAQKTRPRAACNAVSILSALSSPFHQMAAQFLVEVDQDPVLIRVPNGGLGGRLIGDSVGLGWERIGARDVARHQRGNRLDE